MGWAMRRNKEETRRLRTAGTATRGRLYLTVAFFALCYAAVAGRLMLLAQTHQDPAVAGYGAEDALAAMRPDIVDRNGEILATDIRTPSLYANPRQIIDHDDAIDRLAEVLPDLDRTKLRRDLSQDRSFVFVRREMTPAQQAEIFELGIPGIGFVDENRRVYPSGNAASHVLGAVSVDHQGLAGIENYIDREGYAALREAGLTDNQPGQPIQLALDLRVQHSLRDELVNAMRTYDAKAAAGVILNVNTGEIVAMSSLPDYDPNDPQQALDPDKLNRAMTGVFELGSTFKAFTAAMALDSGVATLNSTYDARNPIRVARFQISDFHPQRRILTVPEVFIYSSNIGSAKMALDVGVEGHKAFLSRMGLLDRLQTELPESALPLVPADWKELSTMTIAFGHGLSVTPMQAASAAAALVNGGYLIKPTFLRRTKEEAQKIAARVIKTKTSDEMRYLMRLNVEKGTATKADVAGYRVGGKTGTAEKIVGGRYAKNKLLTSFMGAFPMDNPEYVIMIMLDEPKGTKETHGFATSGWNAVPVSGSIIGRIAPMLGVVPRLDRPEEGNSPILASF